jgi:hypothetical protein
MSNYVVDTQQVKDSILASSLSPSLKDAISSLLGDSTKTHLGNFPAEPHTTVEIGSDIGFALAEAGGKYTATSDTHVIIIDGDASTELNVSIEDPSAHVVIVGGTGDDKIILTDASVLASADGKVGGATIDGRDGDDLIAGSIGNDSLSGSGGDDTISGGKGNDIIDGGDGDDTVSGGKGNDIIDGGDGDDTLMLVGGPGDYSIRFHNGTAVITHMDGGSDGSDTVANVEMLRFGGADTRADAIIERLYEAVMHREADPDGKSVWLEANAGGVSMHDIADGLLRSDEGEGHCGGLSNVEYVNKLYDSVLNRAADRDGLITWTTALENGTMDRADVLLGFVNSAEKLAAEPVVELDFNHSEAATLVRMYDSLFNREADEDGINSHLESLENGASLHDVALSFVNSGEAEELYGSMSDIEFIDKLYSSALDRTADVKGLITWTTVLENGTMDRADVLLSFADSTEKIELRGVVTTTIHHDV